MMTGEALIGDMGWEISLVQFVTITTVSSDYYNNDGDDSYIIT